MTKLRPRALCFLLIFPIFFSGIATSGGKRQASVPTQTGSNSVNIQTHHNDNHRTGANLRETILITANVNPRQFGKLFSLAVDGYIYAQPLYASQIEVPSKGVHNLVFVATEHNSVYAFDADDAAAAGPVWQVSLGTPVPSSDLSSTYRDLMPEVGITSTPVIDLDTKTIYVVAKSKDTSDGSYHQKLHALDLATGQNRFGSPVEIAASVPGTGAGSVDGLVPFNPLLSLNRPGLLLLNGVVYVAFGSHGNIGAHHGWLFGYDARTLQQVAVFNTTPDSEGGSIWMSGQGLAADENGNIYVTTGNGPFDLQNGRRDYGDCALKFSTKNGLALVDYFTPHNTDVLNRFDIDLGAGGPILLPGLNRLVFAGKDTVLRVLDTNTLGGFDPLTDHIVQQFQPSTARMLGAPIYWESPTYGPAIYYWAGGDSLKVYKVLNDRLQNYEVARSLVINVTGISNAAPMSLSANGSKPGTGIVWATGPAAGDANRKTVPGVLRALDAADVTKELWNSQQNADRDDIGNFAKFCPPTIVNGKVYVATFSGKLHVFGLLPGACNFNLSQGNQLVTASAETVDVELMVEDDCYWTANTNDDWINITAGSEGTGSGSIFYSVAPNPGGMLRTGTINIGGLNHIIRQAGAATAVSAANFIPSRLAAESIAAVLGSGLATSAESATNETPTTLAGTTLKVTDSEGTERLAPLFYVSPTQVNYLLPADTAVGPVLITVSGADGNIATSAIQIESVVPGLFSANATGQGVAAAILVRVKPDGAQFFEPVSQFDAMKKQFVSRPIDLGPDLGAASDQVYLVLFGTGFRFHGGLSEVKLQIGGIPVPVLFAGAQGSFAGLDQVNVLLPRTLIGQEEVDVVLKVGSSIANTVKVAVK